MRETFRTRKLREGAKPLRAPAFLDVEGDEAAPQDKVDSLHLAEGTPQ